MARHNQELGEALHGSAHLELENNTPITSTRPLAGGSLQPTTDSGTHGKAALNTASRFATVDKMSELELAPSAASSASGVQETLARLDTLVSTAWDNVKNAFG